MSITDFRVLEIVAVDWQRMSKHAGSIQVEADVSYRVTDRDQRFSLHTARVRMTLDVAALVRYLGPKAIRNSRNVTKLRDGAVVARALYMKREGDSE